MLKKVPAYLDAAGLILQEINLSFEHVCVRLGTNSDNHDVTLNLLAALEDRCLDLHII